MKINTFTRCTVVIGLTLALAGCAKKQIRPLVPKATVLAAYSDGAAVSRSTVAHAFETACEPHYAALKNYFLQKKSALTNQFDGDFLKTYCGIEREKVDWSLLTVGALTRSEKGHKPIIPDLALVIHATFLKEKVVQQMVDRLGKKKDAGKLEAGELAGTPIWRLVHKDLALTDGLAPCLTFIGENVLLFASNEKALQAQLDLYAGKLPAVGADSELAQVVHLKDGVVSRMMMGNIQGLLQNVMTTEERNEANELPYVSTLMRTVRWTTIDVQLIEKPQAVVVDWRVACADEEGAQAVNEMLITMRTSLKMGMSFLIKDKPALKPALEWLSRIKLVATGKEASLSIHVTPEDVATLDVIAWLQQNES